MPQSTVYRLLARHRWRKLAPRPRHPKADPLLQEAFQKKRRRLVAHKRQRQARPGLPLRLMFEEEARLGRISEPRRVGAPPGIRPEVPMPMVREYSYA